MSIEGSSFESGLKTESVEKPKWHFVYVNHEMEGHPVVFECDADEIIEADALYAAKLGIDPVRQNHVGCSLIKN